MSAAAAPAGNGASRSARAFPTLQATARERPAVLAAAALVCALAAVMIAASSALGYAHYQPCYQNPYSRCYDSQGQLYNPWTLVHNGMITSGSVPEVCAKAVTQAGNIKAGSNCQGGTEAYAYIAADPWSLAYGYWGDGGCSCWSAREFTVYART